MKIYDKDYDHVITGVVATGSITYKEANEQLVPLISKTDFQRKLQDKKFYQKLERDIQKGCIMPPITLAFITTDVNEKSSINVIQDFYQQHHQTSFVIDGIQRLNTLSRVMNNGTIDHDKKLYVNIIFTDNEDKLLYRMITLNNGQKPMTPRHQVEMMMANVFDFDGLGIEIQTEKERANKVKVNSFNKSDIVQAYLSYMADSPMIDNQKIIQEKMDELTVNKIISSENKNDESNFRDVINAISKFQNNSTNIKWLKQANNLVGFAVGMKYSKDEILKLSADQFEDSIVTFEQAFSDFNPSKIKLGKMRRELSYEFFKNFNKLQTLDSDDLLQHFSDITND